MRGRRNVPPVARPTGGRRLVELGKDLLILALLCSAAFLAAQTPIVSHLKGWVAPQPPPAAPVQSGRLVSPYAISVRNEKGLYAVSYDEALVGRAFDRFSPFLGEALSTLQAPETISEGQWRLLLESPGVCCVFQGSPPLSALSVWLGGGDEIPDSVQSLLLSWDGRRMWLAWRSGDTYSRARTNVAYEDHLSAALEDFSPNGAAYAYALADDEAYEALDPYVLVSIAAPQPKVCAALSPDLTADSDALASLLTALGFLTGPEGAYETADGLAVTEGGDRLLVTPAGEVVFRAGEEARFPAAPREQRGVLSAYDAALCAWEVLNRAIRPWQGEGSFVLTGAQPTDAGWEITFHAQLGGVPVLNLGEGWTARFLVEGDRISEFILILRTYTATETVTVLPTPRLAAAALRSLPGQGGKLMLCYTDNRGPTLTAGWMTGE